MTTPHNNEALEALNSLKKVYPVTSEFLVIEEALTRANQRTSEVSPATVQGIDIDIDDAISALGEINVFEVDPGDYEAGIKEEVLLSVSPKSFNTIEYALKLLASSDVKKQEPFKCPEGLSCSGDGWDCVGEGTCEPPAQFVDVEYLANIIRTIDGENKMGAGELAEKIIDYLVSRGIIQGGKG